MAYDQTDEASVAALDRIIGADPDNAGVRAQLQETIWSSPKLLLTGIEEQAQTLGITDPNYLWIAARSLLSPLPEGWAQYKDQNGSPYYLNEKTGESRWEHPLDDHYVAMYRSYVSRPRDAPPTPRLGYEGPTPRGPVPEENGRLVDSSPERSRFTGRGPKDGDATVGGARRVSSSTRRARSGSASPEPRSRRRGDASSPEPRPGRRGRQSGSERDEPRSARKGRRDWGTPTSGSEPDAHDERRGSAEKGEAPRTGRLFALPSERRAAAAGRVRSGLTSSSSSEEEEEAPSGRRRRAARGREHSSSSGRRRHSSSEGEERTATAAAAHHRAHASARAADDRGTASSEARRSAPNAPADDPDAVLDRLDEVLASDGRDWKWTDRLLGVLELHSVFSEHNSQVRQATEKLKRNDRAVADAERRADKLREKLKHARDEVDSEVKRREDVERRLSEALSRGSSDDVVELQGRLQKAEQRAQRAAEELGRRVRTKSQREDSDQLVDALRTIDDLEDKLAGALLAGEALQRQCDASSTPVECDADLVRARDEALDRIASLESALSLSKTERDAAKASLSDRIEETRMNHQRLLDAEGRCDMLIQEKADESRRRRRDVDEARSEAFEAEQRCATLKDQLRRLEQRPGQDDARLKRLEKRAEELDAARAREALRADEALKREDELRSARDAARAQAAAAEAAADARRADVQAISLSRDAAEAEAEEKGAADARKLREELESVREANSRFVEASRTRCERAEFHASEAARSEQEARRDADALREKCDSLIEENRRLDQRLDSKDDQSKMWKRDADERCVADLTAFAACARLWRVSLQQSEVDRHALQRMEADVLSARSVAEAEVMSARHDAEIASKQREDALEEVSELRKRLEDQRDKNEEAAKASLTQIASNEAHVAKLDAQLSTATARNKTLEDEVEVLERKCLELAKDLDETKARLEKDAERRIRDEGTLRNDVDEATSARIQAETVRDDYERQCGEHEVEIEHLRSRLDQSEADLERLRSVNERTEERLRGELHEARAESRDVSSKRSQELNEAVEALQLRLAQAEAAKQTAVEELEKVQGDARSELDKEQLKAEAELKIALADSEALRTKLGEVGPSREELNEARARAKDFRDRYMNERKLRRKLTDELAELKGNIRVVARCRPPNDDGNSVVEFPSGAEGALEVVNDHGLTQRFEFDRVFRPGSSQSDIFDHVAPVIQGCFDGIHACIFAYGQTGSGKTHTMEGPPSDRGVYFRALSELFHGKPADTELCVKLSMLEIYNETLIDLLTDKRCKLEVKRCSDGTHEVQGLHRVSVASLEEVQRHVESGSKRRQTGAHDLNDRSSRSHLILSLDVECRRKDEVLSSRLNLVDLAGSERLSRTGATGDRLKEAQSINKSLSSLGDVVNALAKKTQCHVPYRNSKLTYLLQDSLSRAARVLMVVNISPLEADASETICSLAFAARCRDVELGAALARPEAAELMRAKQEIRALRARLDRLALAAK